MKIASFNINNINRRLTNLVDWLQEAEPDVVCFQEIIAASACLPPCDIRDTLYCTLCISEDIMRVAKWGNSLAVRLPKELVNSLSLKAGD